MANVKNFGLVGVGSSVQFGKGGPSLSSQSSTILQADGTAAFRIPVGNDLERPTPIAGLIRANNQLVGAISLEYYNGVDWTTIAAGGDTGAIQAEIDAIETSLGAAIDSSGIFVPGVFTGAPAAATTFTEAIQLIADSSGGATLDEIFPSLVPGNVIYSSGVTPGLWTQDLPGATSGVQPFDAALTALSVKTTLGIMVQTEPDFYTSVSLVAPLQGITITNPDGVAGAPVFALANDLAALENLSTTGMAVRTGDSTWRTTTITGTPGNITVADGNGIIGPPTINLATVTDDGTGTLVKITRDTFGRVAGTTPVVAADITPILDASYVLKAGDTMTGNLVMSLGGIVTGLPEPVDATDATNKAYVDARVSGLMWKTSALVASTGPLAATYASGSDGLNPGIGATLTANPPVAAPLVDNITLDVGDRLLVKNQGNSIENGVYEVSQITSPWILVRAPDMDTPDEVDLATLFVTDGSQADTGWTQTSDVTTIGTDGITFVQITSAGSFTAGDGLALTGNIFSVKMGAGIVSLPTSEVGVDLVPGLALQLTDATTTGQLTFLLDGAGITSGLSQSATGLKIAPAGVTNAMLGVVDVAHGGTGLTSLADGLIPYGSDVSPTDPFDVTPLFAFFDDERLVVGSANLTGAVTGAVTLATTTVGGGIVLSLIDPLMKVSVAGPTAVEYATSLAAGDLANKQYVDDAVAGGGSVDGIKSVKATLDLALTTAQNVGLPIPANSTVLSVKVNVPAASTGTLVVAGPGGTYMPDTENDLTAAGIYVSELYTVDVAGGQITATVTGGAAGTADVFVEYQ